MIYEVSMRQVLLKFNFSFTPLLIADLKIIYCDSAIQFSATVRYMEGILNGVRACPEKQLEYYNKAKHLNGSD